MSSLAAVWRMKTHYRRSETATRTACGMKVANVLTTTHIAEVDCKKCIQLEDLSTRYAQSVGAIP